MHFVDSSIDTGEIIVQRKVAVLPYDSPDTLSARIHKEEIIAIVEAVRKLLDD